MVPRIHLRKSNFFKKNHFVENLYGINQTPKHELKVQLVHSLAVKVEK